MTDEMNQYCVVRLSELQTMIHRFHAAVGEIPHVVNVGWNTYKELMEHSFPTPWGLHSLQVNGVPIGALAPSAGEEAVELESKAAFRRYYSAHSFPRHVGATPVYISLCECGSEKLGHPGHSHWCHKA